MQKKTNKKEFLFMINYWSRMMISVMSELEQILQLKFLFVQPLPTYE